MFDKYIKKTVNKVIEEFNKDENQKKIYEEFLNPILERFIQKIYPYVTLLFIMYIINLLLIVAILIIIINTRNVK